MTTRLPSRPWIGGSILPSSNPQILTPIDYVFGRLQVRELPDADTHALILTTKDGERELARHPNGYSCHALAKRMAFESVERTQQQAEYIVACGGSADLPAILAACAS